MSYWLFKSEPSSFSIDDLFRCQHQTEPWNGVRNYQARNMLRDLIKKNDGILFYHSNCSPPGIVGTAKVVKEAYPDPTAFDPFSPYYDEKSTAENPRWYVVDVKWQSQFSKMLTLEMIKNHPVLSHMQVAKRGNRLSITPVTKNEWESIQTIAHTNS